MGVFFNGQSAFLWVPVVIPTTVGVTKAPHPQPHICTMVSLYLWIIYSYL